ncbi:hypothetical protein QR680_003468 [Steinernema hermaphroditum]|uniref:SLC41A/MgtE integral membrane domain-containing protein n=1 Tax=Steinernema hermaphroditum TaxID=289476 RepID=A0AA39H7X8_9BILA|nr:hypothetical protein QR680_003468 [Steinernema hermaphroditum]
MQHCGCNGVKDSLGNSVEFMNKLEALLTKEEQPTFEKKRQFFAHALISLSLCVVGFIIAGHVLNYCAQTTFFQNVSHAISVVPVLCGAKGNIEMTFVSRLSSAARMGRLGNGCGSIFYASVALAVAQTIFIATVLTAVFGISTLTSVTDMTVDDYFLLFAIVYVSMVLSAFFISVVVYYIILLCLDHKCDPDSIMIPVCALIGDVACIVVYTLMVVQLAAGTFLHETTSMNMQKFQPLLNGIGGNVAAVVASRTVSSFSDQRERTATSLLDVFRLLLPWNTFGWNRRATNATCTTLLIVISLPLLGMSFFFIDIDEILSGAFNFTIFGCYFVTGSAQTVVLLLTARFLCHLFQKYKLDPDSNVIPIITSVGDLMSSLLFNLLLRATGVGSQPTTRNVSNESR